MRILITLLVVFSYLSGQIMERQNKLLWDGTDWDNIQKKVNRDIEITFRIKSSYLSGVLDGRLYYYLKAWGERQAFADSLYGDRVDYMTRRETIRQLDRFYENPLMDYVPVVSAVIIVHMQTEQVPKRIVDRYVDQTKGWINQLTLDMENKGMHRLLKEKHESHIKRN